MKKILVLLGTLFLVLVLAYVFHIGGTREGLTRQELGLDDNTQLSGDGPFSLDNDNQYNDGFQRVLDRERDPLLRRDEQGNFGTVEHNPTTGETRFGGGGLSDFTGSNTAITDEDINNALNLANTVTQSTTESLNEMNAMDID